MAKYAIGVDYGTLSGRALLVDVKIGEELATAALDYPHGVMDKKLLHDYFGRGANDVMKRLKALKE